MADMARLDLDRRPAVCVSLKQDVAMLGVKERKAVDAVALVWWAKG